MYYLSFLFSTDKTNPELSAAQIGPDVHRELIWSWLMLFENNTEYF